MTFALLNEGSALLSLLDDEVEDPQFALISQLPATLQPGQQATGIQVRFTPSTTGAIPGTLSIQTDSDEIPTLEIPLDGTGS